MWLDRFSLANENLRLWSFAPLSQKWMRLSRLQSYFIFKTPMVCLLLQQLNTSSSCNAWWTGLGISSDSFLQCMMDRARYILRLIPAMHDGQGLVYPQTHSQVFSINSVLDTFCQVPNFFFIFFFLPFCSLTFNLCDLTLLQRCFILCWAGYHDPKIWWWIYLPAGGVGSNSSFPVFLGICLVD